MKKTILAVFTMIAMALTNDAQVIMRVELKDGNHVDYPVSTVESVSWITSEVDNTDKTPIGVEAVDLGLPSGLKWANMNVGAAFPEDYGWYLAWGETEPKDYYDRDVYFDSNSDKYSTSKKKVLDLEDDAAHVNWGGNWRMPTYEEQKELIDNCNWTWTIQNGVKGDKVTSKTNGNSIFLPAAGFYWYKVLLEVGYDCQYWSSSLADDGYAFHFVSDFWDCKVSTCSTGRTVRAVCP